MRFEPAVDRARLIEAVREAYGIPARELRFVPLGLGAAACYELCTSGDDGYFLKVWPQLRLGQAAATRQHASLALTRALNDRGVGVCVPDPVPTREGGLWAELSGMPLAIFPLLPGAPPDPWPVALREELGRTIAALHRATPALADVLPPRETFDIAFEPALRRDLEAAARIGPDARPGLCATRAWVLGHQDGILAQLEQLHRLQATVRGLDGPFVLCHNDLHGGNVLSDEGQLCILDWDDAKVAPPEHDLWAGLGGGRPRRGLRCVPQGLPGRERRRAAVPRTLRVLPPPSLR